MAAESGVSANSRPNMVTSTSWSVSIRKLTPKVIATTSNTKIRIFRTDQSIIERPP